VWWRLRRTHVCREHTDRAAGVVGVHDRGPATSSGAPL